MWGAREIKCYQGEKGPLLYGVGSNIVPCTCASNSGGTGLLQIDNCGMDEQS